MGFGPIRKQLSSSFVIFLLAIALWGYVVGPLVATFEQSITGNGGGLTEYTNFFDLRHGAQGESMLGSLIISALSVITSGLTGAFLAVLLKRWDFPLRRVCEVLVLVPIALPPLMGVQAFVLLYGIGGTFPQLLSNLFHTSKTAFAVDGISGVLLVHTLTMYPYFYLTVAAALEQSDDSLEEAAYSLGASRFQAWTRVLLPMLTPALVAGALLTFMSSMSSYTAPLLFHVDQVMTQQIVIAKLNGQLGLASVVSVMLALISVAFLIVLRTYEKRAGYTTLSKGGARKRRRVSSPLWKTTLVIVASISSIFLILPIAMIFLLAFSVNGSWRAAPLPSQYTLQNFIGLFTNPSSWAAVVNSLEMSALAVAGAILLGLASAYVIARMRFRGKAVMDIAVMLPWALPGTVVAINLITAFASPSIFSLGRVMVGTFAIVPLAYFVRFSPLVFRSTSASLTQIDVGIEEAARSLGATWWYAFRQVVLPLLYRGLAGGALLAFVDGVGEFVATILLYTPQYRPLSIAINDELYYANYGTAASLGVIQVLLVLAVVIIMLPWNERETVTYR
ncbi:MAG TPA: iron ABC transporter permease [Terriglobia bacterium]|nr:iron ABC transporter permease [Terriglobia bacterium]